MRGNGPLDGEAVGVLLDLTPRSYLRQLVVRWSKEDRIKHTGRGMYQNLNSKETRREGAGGRGSCTQTACDSLTVIAATKGMSEKTSKKQVVSYFW